MLAAKIIIGILIFCICLLCGMLYQQEKKIIEINRLMKGLEEIGTEKDKEKDKKKVGNKTQVHYTAEAKTVTLHRPN